MNHSISAPANRPSPIASRAVRTTLLLLAGSAVLALSAKVEIPFWPVPMTLQVLAVLALAGIFGGRLAGGMVALYLLEGALGLPVFAGAPERGIGLAYMAGPTGGYLAGMLVAAFAVGEWCRRGRPGAVSVALGMLAGIAIVYALGALWLALFVGWGTVLAAGILPFLAGDVVKAMLAVCLTVGARRLRADC